MRCVEARQLFSPWLDGELDEAFAVALRLHLEGCGDCSRELALWQDVSQTLKQACPEAAAPFGFAAGVMARIREEVPAGQSRKARSRAASIAPWKQWLAVAAAAAVLVFGWWAVKPDLPGKPGQVAGETGGTVTEVKTADSGSGTAPVEVKPGAGNAGQSGGSVSAGSGSTSGDTQPSGSGDSGTGNPSAGTAQPSGSSAKPSTSAAETRVFLNKERKITSTLIRLSVADLAAGQAQALATASSFGCSPELVAQQSAGSEKWVIYRMMVDTSKAESLEDACLAMGKVIDYQEETRDVTQEFARTLEQYRAVAAQAAAVQDEAEKKELEAKMKDLEEQLVAWDSAAGKHTIVLWLQ